MCLVWLAASVAVGFAVIFSAVTVGLSILATTRSK